MSRTAAIRIKSYAIATRSLRDRDSIIRLSQSQWRTRVEAFLERPDGCKLVYVIDDFTDPWLAAPTVLFVHGLAESTEAWRA